jgi:hypothetical protein
MPQLACLLACLTCSYPVMPPTACIASGACCDKKNCWPLHACHLRMTSGEGAPKMGSWLNTLSCSGAPARLQCLAPEALQVLLKYQAEPSLVYLPTGQTPLHLAAAPKEYGKGKAQAWRSLAQVRRCTQKQPCTHPCQLVPVLPSRMCMVLILA